MRSRYWLPAPPLAVGANCEDQLAALKSQLAEKAEAHASVDAKYQEAQRLCGEKKEAEAQDLVRQIREQMAQNSGAGAGAASGSSNPPGSSKPSSGAPRTDSK